MPCETCNAQFNLFKRKKCCYECKRLYCNQCVIKRKELYLCDRCVVFTRRPISKIELLQLKPKDLIFYLQSKHISTTGCVEKEELVNLVLNHVNSSVLLNTAENDAENFSDPNSYSHNHSENSSSNAFDNLKQTCQNIFTHFTEKIATDLNFDLKTSASGQNQNIFSQPRASSRPTAPTTSTSPTNTNVCSSNSTIISSFHNNPSLANNQNQEQPRIHQQQPKQQQKPQSIPIVPKTIDYSTSNNRLSQQRNNSSGPTSPSSSVPSSCSLSSSANIFSLNSDNQPSDCIVSNEPTITVRQNLCLTRNHSLNLTEQSQITTISSELNDEKNIVVSNVDVGESSESSIHSRCIDKNVDREEPNNVLSNHDCDCSDDELLTNFKKSYNSSKVVSPVSENCLLTSPLQLSSRSIPLLSDSVTPISSTSSQQQPQPSLQTQVELKLHMELEQIEQNENTKVESNILPTLHSNHSYGTSESLSFEEIAMCSSNIILMYNVDNGVDSGLCANKNGGNNSSSSSGIQIDDDVDEVNIMNASVEKDTWQFIKTPNKETDHSSRIEQQPKTSTTDVPFSILENNIAIIPGTSTDAQVSERTISINNIDLNDIPSTSMANNKRIQFSCDKCGKSKNMNLQRHVEKFRRQLETYNIPETDMKEQLEAFLGYLEMYYNRSSFEQSDSDGGVDGGMSPRALSSNVHHENLNDITHSILSTTGSTTEFITLNQGEANETFSYNGPGDLDIEFLYGDDEGIHVYGTDDPNCGYTGPTRRFINLNDFSSSDELDDLSVKQLKEILMLNRVDFKGCCEKKELLERVERLWNEYNSCPAVDKLPSDDLCKICMDAPIECVILECGHMTTCTNCGKVLSECPICRQYITRVVRFFRA